LTPLPICGTTLSATRVTADWQAWQFYTRG